MYRHNEKNDSRLAASVTPETEDFRDGLKFGPADPMRTKRAMACGSQAKLFFSDCQSAACPVMRTKCAVLYSPFVDVEDFEPECCQCDFDQGYNGDADSDGHTAAGDRRKHLSADDAVDRRIAFHEDDVEQGDDLGRIVAHEKARHDLKTERISFDEAKSGGQMERVGTSPLFYSRSPRPK
jgi:hypothetical protein